MLVPGICKVDNETVRIRTYVPKALYNAVIERSDGNISGFVKAALWTAVTSRRAYLHREINVMPNADGSVDRAMEWLLARQPLLLDVVDAGGELDARVRKHLRMALSETQFRRVALRFQGYSLEEIGVREGCSKQAVFNTLVRVDGRLRRDQKFYELLIRVLDPYEDTGITSDLLMELST